MDILSKLDITKGKYKLFIYRLIYNKNFIVGKHILCSGSIRVRCNDCSMIKISNNVKLNSRVILHATGEGQIHIKNNTGLSHGVIIAAKKSISIGKSVMIGPYTCIYDHDHVYKINGSMHNSGFNTENIIIEDNVWIASNCTILKGSIIGSGSVIGAGTIIKGNIPANSIVYGNKLYSVKKISKLST